MEIRPANLGAAERAVQEALAELAGQDVIGRIWSKDASVWRGPAREIAGRLGWLTAPEDSLRRLPGFEALAFEVRAEGFREAAVLGMGGSSLAPEVLSRVFPTGGTGLRLSIHDSTAPAAVLEAARRLDIERTLFLVSSKSGTTVETLSLFRYFYGLVAGLAGREAAGRSFLALTDPDTPLEREARALRFRAVVHGDRDVGGRFSVFTPFGVVPAALQGLDVRRLLGEGRRAAALCREADPARNPGARLGAMLAVMAREGRDKLSLVASEEIRPFGAWLEQLVAESTGKNGRGILPVLEDSPLAASALGADRFYAVLRLEGDARLDADIRALADRGVPHAVLPVADRYELGGQFFLWEMATAVAGRLLEVNPFDQPNVESAKAIARDRLRAFREEGAFPVESPSLAEDGIALFGAGPAGGLGPAFRTFLDLGRTGDYVALLAFLAPDAATEALLRSLTAAVRDRTGLASTWGWGPRYLHSTGQLHKGDAGRGLFIVLSAADAEDIPIPDAAGEARSATGFGTLKAAQALGDDTALRTAGRRVLRVDLGSDATAGLKRLVSLLDVRDRP
ncbi:MAG: glucose-6-phosphate isomerase [Candidatus Aminicenantes bacterium]|nr:glucose-6-phosphate isomerase [Candidatus Aminicenantes bacterium]